MDFFISYNSKDAHWAEWIAWELEAVGYSIHIQAWDFAAGSNFVLEMDKGAKLAKRMIAVLSRHFLDAEFTQPEWAAAFRHDPLGHSRRLVPVRVDDCEPVGLLAQIVYVDLVGLDESSARDRLLGQIRATRSKPTTRPPFPSTSTPPMYPGGKACAVDDKDRQRSRTAGSLGPHGNGERGTLGTGSVTSLRERHDPSGGSAPRPQIRVVIADDHTLVTEGLARLIEEEPDITVVATATDGESLLQMVRCHLPDVAVVDIEMPPWDGFECVERIRSEFPNVRVLVCTAFGQGEQMRRALELGAEGFTLKTEPPYNLLSCIRRIYGGGLAFPLAARKWLLQEKGPYASEALSHREAEILACASDGLTNAQIARRLRLTVNTVKFHLQNIYIKLNVRNRDEAAAWYLRTNAGS